MSSRLIELGLSEAVSRRLTAYHRLLLEEAIPSGFMGPREADRLLERHVLEGVGMAALLSRLDPVTLRAMDVGAGAGLPGLVLACMGRPVCLVESDRRRAAFLRRVAVELELEAQVLAGRAEALARRTDLREAFEVVVSRALAQPATALELMLPFVRQGGLAVLVVGPDAETPQAAAHQLGGDAGRIELFEVPGSRLTARAMIVEKVHVTPPRYPRRDGMPAKRPLADS